MSKSFTGEVDPADCKACGQVPVVMDEDNNGKRHHCQFLELAKWINSGSQSRRQDALTMLEVFGVVFVEEVLMQILKP